MNLRNVVFCFFILLAASLNFGFVVGDISDPVLHNIYQLFAATVISVIVTALKLGDRTPGGVSHLAASLVADLQLMAAVIVWSVAEYGSGRGLTAGSTAVVVSLSAGAFLSNLVSVTLLVRDTVPLMRK